MLFPKHIQFLLVGHHQQLPLLAELSNLLGIFGTKIRQLLFCKSILERGLSELSAERFAFKLAGLQLTLIAD